MVLFVGIGFLICWVFSYFKLLDKCICNWWSDFAWSWGNVVASNWRGPAGGVSGLACACDITERLKSHWHLNQEFQCNWRRKVTVVVVVGWSWENSKCQKPLYCFLRLGLQWKLRQVSTWTERKGSPLYRRCLFRNCSRRRHTDSSFRKQTGETGTGEEAQWRRLDGSWWDILCEQVQCLWGKDCGFGVALPAFSLCWSDSRFGIFSLSGRWVKSFKRAYWTVLSLWLAKIFIYYVTSLRHYNGVWTFPREWDFKSQSFGSDGTMWPECITRCVFRGPCDLRLKKALHLNWETWRWKPSAWWARCVSTRFSWANRCT